MAIGPSARPTGLLEARPPAFSLLTVPGVRVDPEDTRWLNSVAVEPDDCQVPLLLSDAQDGDWPYWWECPEGSGVSAVTALASETSGVKKVGDQRNNVAVNPVTIWAGYKCSTLDLHGDVRKDEIVARVTRKLRSILPAAVERELESGQIARLAGFSNHYLRDISTVTQLTADLGYVTALAEMEQALATNGIAAGRRIIHAQPRVVTAWSYAHLIEVSPDRTHLLTQQGTYVVPGTGYRGGAPGVDPASQGNSRASWIYGTGMVHILLDTPQSREFEINQAAVTSRDLNNAEIRLEQGVAIVFDPCPHIAALVDLCDPSCGGGS